MHVDGTNKNAIDMGKTGLIIKLSKGDIMVVNEFQLTLFCFLYALNSMMHPFHAAIIQQIFHHRIINENEFYSKNSYYSFYFIGFNMCFHLATN